MTPNHVKLLYTFNILVFFAVLAGFFYIRALQQAPRGESLNNGVVQSGASPTDQTSTVTVGNNADNPASKRLGVITEINGESLTLKDVSSGSLYAVSISYSTKVELLGAAKPAADYQKELDAYYAQIKLLMQDPVKNKAALGALQLPQTNYFKTGSITDLAVGDPIAAIADAPITGSSFVAVKIVKATPQAR